MSKTKTNCSTCTTGIHCILFMLLTVLVSTLWQRQQQYLLHRVFGIHGFSIIINNKRSYGETERYKMTSKRKNLSMQTGNYVDNNNLRDDILSNYDVLFVTNRMCPFAQKVWIALEVYSIQYNMIEISLYGPNGKPKWFLQHNPKGTIPVLLLYSKKKSQQHLYPTVVASNTGTLKPYMDQVPCNVLTDSDTILDFIYVTCCCGGNNDTDNSNQLLWWRQNVINQQLLPIGKQIVTSSSSSSNLQQQVHDLFRQMEERMIQEVSLSNKQKNSVTNSNLSPTVYSMDGSYQYDDLSSIGGSRLDAELQLQNEHQPLATIADCHAFPFLYRIIEHEQHEFSFLNLQERYPTMYAWYQQWKNHPAFLKTTRSTQSWWWWW